MLHFFMANVAIQVDYCPFFLDATRVHNLQNQKDISLVCLNLDYHSSQDGSIVAYDSFCLANAQYLLEDNGPTP